MNIGEVEKLTKVPKKTIRFYEEQELIKPQRADNGYRIYTDNDIRALEEIRFLRSLQISLDQIKRIREGSLSLAEAVEKQREKLTKEQEKLEKVKEISKAVAAENLKLSDIDFNKFEERVAELGDIKLSSVEEYSRKDLKSSNIAAIIFILFFACIFAVMIFVKIVTPEFPTWALIMIEIILAIPIAGTIAALIERKKEIKKGEVYDASKY